MESFVYLTFCLPELWSLNCSKEYANLSKKSKSMKAIYLYPSKRPHHVLSENVIICRGLSNSSRDIEELNIKKSSDAAEI